MEQTVCAWNGYTKRKFFNYLLIKSDILRKLKGGITGMGEVKNLAEKIDILSEDCVYAGKGQADRPLDHLIKAAKGDNIDDKSKTIREVWESGNGIIVYQGFHNSTTHEASTREAVLIDFFSTQNMTNIRKGSYYGRVGNWPGGKIYNMGLHYVVKILIDLMLHRHMVFLKSDVM
jgi:hypothetical protein